MTAPAAPASAQAPIARIIPRSEHTISRRGISPNALRVLYRLREAGFQAFLVGGCVRDLLLGIEPKDFDVATDALPEQVKKLFRNCRLVGRRFRLAHVFFGRETIEVATFRASGVPIEPDEPLADADPEDGEAAELDDPRELGLSVVDLDDDEDDDGDDLDEGEDVDEAAPPRREPARRDDRARRAEPPERAEAGREEPAARRSRDERRYDDEDDTERVVDESGRILRDNVYGTIDEDVWRRDFTANSLYYNIADFSIWDYTGGVEDVAARRLTLIGDPETRFREDPVRMLRAARFQAKLGFAIEPATEEPIARLAPLLADMPPSRLFDEMVKLFLGGHGAKSLGVLRRLGLLAHLLPSVDEYLAAHPGSAVERLLVRGLENTDARVQADKPVTPTFLIALLVYGPIARIIEGQPPERWHEIGTIMDACDQAVREAAERMTIPKRFSLGVREMFALQPRLEHPRGRRALRVLEHPRFRAAFDLLLLRAEIGMAPPEMARWWGRLQEVSNEERGRMCDELVQRTQGPGSGGGTQRRSSRGGRRRRRGPRPS